MYRRSYDPQDPEETSDIPGYLKWYEHEPCKELAQYKIIFGHAIHEHPDVAHWAISLDKGAVYGRGYRVMLIDTNGEDTFHEYPTDTYYISSHSWRNG